MPVVSSLTKSIPAATPYYRITSLSSRTSSTGLHKKVVNGEGAVKSRYGARYNHPGARAVYLAEDPLTCFAERMFYFHREVLPAIDISHVTGVFPPFQQRFVIWEIMFQNTITGVFELSVVNASSMNVFPTLMLSPAQDYHHLKDRRAAIEHLGYNGLRAPSSRVRGPGHMVVLFADQSKNVQRITPFEVEFRLITSDKPPRPFANLATDVLDYCAGEVRVGPAGAAASYFGAGSILSSATSAFVGFAGWTQVDFNH